MALFLRTSSEMLSDWNRQRIVDALLRETNIDRDTAEQISREVEEQILSSKISLVTAPLVRELVDAKPDTRVPALVARASGRHAPRPGMGRPSG